jgi:hypothetical protein
MGQTNISFQQKFYRYAEKMFIDLTLNNDSANVKEIKDFFLKIDNLCIHQVYENFSKWFQKDITMEDLLDFYIPSLLIQDTKIYPENIELNTDSDIDSNTDSSYNSSLEEDDKIINKYVVLEVPYDKEENELDIIIYDKNNNEVDEYQEIKPIQNSIGILKLKGINIEKKKFYTIWELVQLKIMDEEIIKK